MFSDNWNETISLVRMNVANDSEIANISFPCVGNGTYFVEYYNLTYNYLLF